MPVYEYSCNACGKGTSVFLKTMAEPESVTCEHCGGGDVRRAISRFAVARSVHGVWDSSEAPAATNSDDYYKDPRNIGRWTEKRLGELGVDMPSEAREMIDAAREGTMPAPLDDL